MARPAFLDAIDTRLATLLPALQTRQTAYAASHGGRYFQGLWSHTTRPADGNTAAPDQLDTKPHYQTETWRDMGGALLIPADSRARVCLDQYIGPRGNGYVLVIEAGSGAEVWRKSVNFGPETWRTHDWQLI